MIDRDYIYLLHRIREYGVETYNKRTGSVCKMLPHQVMNFNASKSTMPLLQLRKINWQAALAETKWFINGYTNTNYLGFKFWDPWADENGNLGPIYGQQWARQLNQVLSKLLDKNDDRRLIVNSWQLDDLPKMALAPCHYSYQFTLTGNTLHLLVNMRSCDVPIGLPFNLLNYWYLLMYVSAFVECTPGRLTFMLANAHYYQNQEEAVDKLMNTEIAKNPIKFTTKPCLSNYTGESQTPLGKFRAVVNSLDIEPVDYNPKQELKIPVTV